MAGKCRRTCDGNHDGYCCLGCPNRKDCNMQCDLLDVYEFVEDCPWSIKESEE